MFSSGLEKVLERANSSWCHRKEARCVYGPQNSDTKALVFAVRGFTEAS